VEADRGVCKFRETEDIPKQIFRKYGAASTEESDFGHYLLLNKLLTIEDRKIESGDFNANRIIYL
jgi:hypothetical protein